ncbi:coiled-coil domain-containing protein 93 [Biomphalaria glabrata]|uniref:Coiled-coil domain-containing protein 93 n=1 Tax=Biomphalaria glabrata TaxID=6526 RepID=A0A2C9K8B8_BIOGL|nr:coiled-coil domain-containing protein 93-like [Biomphalaria glabrata]KAI8788977.1 coiled-coil domain-containing protein 93 [Biomphalaria glabrata]
MATTSKFGGRLRSGSEKFAVVDADGNRVEVETREDEEQNVKLQQTIDLLLAAGYFRARIKGLSPFDKVVGGMTWCITTCNFDVDVDLLFQENSTIGQKIALTESIVAVLPRMKCPHRIEPHQIQGLDFIHIFPVVQWLVKKAIETREEMGDYIRSFSISQFNKSHKMPEDELFEKGKEKSLETLSNVKDVYKPQRKYRRHDVDKLKDEETRVQSTLLEYGRQYGVSHVDKDQKESAAKKKGLLPGMTKDTVDDEDDAEAEEERIKALMSGMSAMEMKEGKVAASAVGSLVGLKSQEIQKIASEFAQKQAEREQTEKQERQGGVQQHKRITTALKKQIEAQQSKYDELSAKHKELYSAYVETKEMLDKVQEESNKIDQEMEEIDQIENSENQGILQTLRALVAKNESLKKQEQEFKAQCKEEMAKLKQNIEKLKEEGNEADSEDKERVTLIDKQYNADKEKLHKIRLLLAKKNREIAALQRKIDEVPSRAELSQYQRRFVELYNQVASKHIETKQFFTLYNTLEDTKTYLNKEVQLLNSIHDNFQTAMSSPANKEAFLKQFEQIVEGVKQNKAKAEKKKQEEKMKRDQLSDQHQDLIEKQRLYFKTVKEFKEECRKNEILLSKLRSG